MSHDEKIQDIQKVVALWKSGGKHSTAAMFHINNILTRREIKRVNIEPDADVKVFFDGVHIMNITPMDIQAEGKDSDD